MDSTEVVELKFQKLSILSMVEESESLSPRDIALDWLLGFSEIFTSGDVSGIAEAFLPNGWFRDSLVFGWNSRSLGGTEKITEYLSEVLPKAQFTDMAIDESPGFEPQFVPYSQDTSGLEFAFTFETPVIVGRGYARLSTNEDGEYKALAVYMELKDIKGHEEIDHEVGVYEGHTVSWEEVSMMRRMETEAHPQVVIIGAGQTGLQVAARFKQMGMRTIVLERNSRIGDNWRQRYPTLTLHTPRTHHSFLYSPYPRNWPTFTPRDKVAQWLELFAVTQDLVIWMSSSVLPTPQYDDKAGRWTVNVDRDGELVTLHPEHVVLATGTLGDPIIPDIPNAHLFKGPIFHASKYGGGHPFAHKRVLVVGAGNSAADICQDLHACGAASVTMLQRSATCVVSAAVVAQEYAVKWPEGVSIDVSDFKVAAMPLGLLKEFAKATQGEVDEFDREMQEGLMRAGLKLTTGPDGSGQKILVLERLGGYWIDAGVAEDIASGLIAIKSGAEVREFTENGVIFTDGTDMKADVVIYATGYRNIRPSMKSIFGSETIDRTTEVWGLDSESELRGCYRPSGHPGLWYAGGDFYHSRYMSKQLALLVKARLLGISGTPSVALTEL